MALNRLVTYGVSSRRNGEFKHIEEHNLSSAQKCEPTKYTAHKNRITDINVSQEATKNTEHKNRSTDLNKSTDTNVAEEATKNTEHKKEAQT